MTGRGRSIKLPHLEAWRKHSMLSLDDLEKLAGVSRQTIAKIEQGSGGYAQTVRTLAEALGVSPQVLAHTPPPKRNTDVIESADVLASLKTLEDYFFARIMQRVRAELEAMEL